MSDRPLTGKHYRSLLIGAIGVVYGDIGTSPLYALKSCFSISGIAVHAAHILGLLSLLLWSLFIVVSVKYIALVMPVDHDREGGILALSARCLSLKVAQLMKPALWLGLIGVSLFFGDCIITPAISVLSAIEGITLISHTFSSYVIPISIGIIIGLFSIQKNGSGRIGDYFGVIMIIWFIVIGGIGLYWIMKNPAVLHALNPYYALHFLMTKGHIGFIAVGGVILAVTGAEALYADMGHFGRHSIKTCWTFFVFPALVCNYLGQGALLLLKPTAISNPFYLMVPNEFLVPLVILATCATIIASQAVISGIFSLGWQAIMLNYLPRMHVHHTSDKQIGQVYVPVINWILCILTLGIVLVFKNSDNLASAYGLSVSGIMLITTFLIFMHAVHGLQWKWWILGIIFTPLFLLDLTFFTCSLLKLFDGAWCTVIVTCVTLFILHVWIKFSKFIAPQRHHHDDINTYIQRICMNESPRIPGAAVFLSRIPNTVPKSLALHIQHNKFLHEKVFVISMQTKTAPRIPSSKRFHMHEIAPHIYHITVHFGYKDIPDIHKVMRWIYEQGILAHDTGVSYFMSRSIMVIGKSNWMRSFQSKVFRFLSHSAQNGTEFYRIPYTKVIEIGVHYKL